jgi:type IV pilus assembly protein PilQ
MKTALIAISLVACCALGVGAAFYLAGASPEPAARKTPASAPTVSAPVVVRVPAPKLPPLEQPLSTSAPIPEPRWNTASLPGHATPAPVAAVQLVAPVKLVESVKLVAAETAPRVAQQLVAQQPAARRALPAARSAATGSSATGSSATGPLQLASAPDVTQLLEMLQSGGGKSDSMGNIMEAVKKLQENPEAMQQLMSNPVLQQMGLVPKQADAPVAAQPDQAAAAGELPAPAGAEKKEEALPPKSNISHLPGSEGDQHLVINLQESDIREVLEMLSEQGNLNILASSNVQGKVSAVLKDVDVNTALDAILKSTGYVSKREGKFIYVGTQQDFASLKTSLDTIGTRVYRPNYVMARDLQTLISPLLTGGVGKSSITAPPGTGIAIDSTAAGGESLAAGEAVVVQDYEAVLNEIDQIVREIDKKPLQVAIEAMILSVTLNDNNKFGIDFQVLRQNQNLRIGSGTPRVDPLAGTQTENATGGTSGEFTFTNGGLQFAFLDSNLGAFITALETIGDTNVIATPRLMCLNKQKAEILIGAQIGYTTTTLTQTFSAQSVQFLDVGTSLRLRPFVSTDGSIRMEVHPELSSGQVSSTGIPSKNVTQVTTNIMCSDGCTVIIGGLMQENLTLNTTQIPLLGGLPVVGPLFRTKTDQVTRNEILVLITPRIVNEPEFNADAQNLAADFHRREAAVTNNLSPIMSTSVARRYMRRAEQAWREGNLKAASRLIDMAVHLNPEDRNAIALRAEIENGSPPPITPSEGSGFPPPGDAQRPGPSPQPVPPSTLDGQNISPWILDDLQGNPAGPNVPPYPSDPGTPGYRVNIKQTPLFNNDSK